MVSFVRIAGEKSDSLKEAIAQSIDLIQFSFDENIRTVAIKPNLCYYWDYSTGETTDPEFVGALIDVLRERLSSNLGISVVESDASAMRCKYAFQMLGYRKLSMEKKVKLINLTLDKNSEIELRTSNGPHKIYIPQTIANADLLVNVPKIKGMPYLNIKITCALKNIYGCNAYQKKYVYHNSIDEVIVGLNKLIKPDLCVVDGNIIKGVKPFRLGLVMSSTDPVAIDSASCRIIGLDPQSVGYILLAFREGVGNIHFIERGETLESFRKHFSRLDKINEKTSFQRFLTFLNNFASHYFEEKYRSKYTDSQVPDTQ